MAEAAIDAPLGAKSERRIVRRHGVIVRITHWVNAIAVILMILSGLQIFNAHPALYWGQTSTFRDPWVAMRKEGDRGITTIGSLRLDTTGVLGYSKNEGVWEARGFPSWATIPARRNLAVGRNWHLFFAWVFAVNFLIYLGTGLLTRRLQREVLPSGRDLRQVHKDPHLRLKFPKGEAALRYHPVQRIAYSGVVFVVIPLIILTGLTMSPSINAAAPWMLDLFGGRQSARTLHFLCMTLIALFFFVHIVMVLLSGPINQLRGMITGKVAVKEEGR